MLKGIDISAYQSVQAADKGQDFVIVKATEGTGYVSNVCDGQYQRAKKAGKLLGVYHFARPDLNKGVDGAKREAQYFVKNIKGYIKEAILVLDYEVAPYSDDWSFAFMQEVHNQTGVWPMLYASASKINGFNWSKTAANCGLWIAGYPAKYDVTNPPVPGVNDMPYKIGAWKFWCIWQYSSCRGQLDVDIANLDRTAWMKYANPGGSTPAPTPQPAPAPAKKSVDEIADEVLAGKWGNGQDRKNRLEAAGYNYDEVQAAVNKKLYGNTPSTTINYAVRKGDTLSSIAAKYGTTWQKIAADNGLKNPNLIYPGQRLVIKK